MKTFLPLILLLPALSCAPAYEDIPVKLVGVGYDPDEIGPSPTPYGGVVEYSWVNFAGGGLSLAMMGLGSFAEVGPGMSGFSPPYAAVYGFSYVFDTKLSAADSLGGVTSVPPEVDDSCYTSFRAAGPIGSFKTVDVGSWMEFTTNDKEGGVRLNRIPADYPANQQDLFVYYSIVDYWAAEPIFGLLKKGASDDPARMGQTLVRTRNFPFGERLEFNFPGSLAGPEAPIGSIPRPSASVGNASIDLPNAPGGVQISWTGTRFDVFGNATGGGDQSTCLSYAAPETAPENAEACNDADTVVGSDFVGQVYTGPWDTDDGKVAFRWTAGDGENADEFVSLAVRFLGPVDKTDTRFGERIVRVTETDAIKADWNAAVRDDRIPEDVAIPEGRRQPTACEPGEWVFDDSFVTADGDLSPALRGDPQENLAEVTCRLKDDGEFVLSDAIVENALTYAKIHGAEGAVFYLARSTEVEANVPPAKDQYSQKHDISPIKLTSRAIDIGRFWLE